MVFEATAIVVTGSARVTMSGNRESCPKCGHLADIQDGEYTFVRGVLSAFKGRDRESIEQFRDIVSAAKAGTITSEEAADQAAQIHTTFAWLITQASNWGVPALSLLVALVSVYLQWAANHDSAISSQEMLLELQADRHVNEQMLDVLKRLDEEGRPAPEVQ